MSAGLLALLVLLPACVVTGLQDGIARVPPMGWSTWLTFRFELNETLVRTSADFLATSKLRTAGYEYILMYAVLGSPLILQNDIRQLDGDLLALVTAPEVIAIAQDPQCVKGSMPRSAQAWDIWVRPLSDGSFAAVLLNKGLSPTNITLHASSIGQSGDFFPALFERYTVRDVLQRQDLGVKQGDYTVVVPAQDATMLRITPTT